MKYIIINQKDSMIYSKEICSGIYHFVRTVSECKKFSTKLQAENVLNKLKSKRNFNNYIIERVK